MGHVQMNYPLLESMLWRINVENVYLELRNEHRGIRISLEMILAITCYVYPEKILTLRTVRIFVFSS